MKKKIGLFFGSFNPVTIAHLEVANRSLKTGLDEIWFIVSPHNPLKNIDDLASESKRLNMVQMVCRLNAKFKAIDIEFDLEKPSYTINTLNYILDSDKRNNITNEYFIIFGTDAINNIDRWKEYEKIISMFKFIVFVRDNKDIREDLLKLINVFFYIKSDSIVSSTAVRNLIKIDQSIDGLVIDEVKNYLQITSLYKNDKC